MPAIAQISPGKLSTAHQTLEGLANCTKCHQLGAAIADDKCLGCHKYITGKRTDKSGYHASTEVTGKNCSSCHREHNGRDYELIYWPDGQKSFNHKLTGYDLEGTHREKACKDCHKPIFIRPETIKSDETIKPEKTFFGLTRDCRNCHADEHSGQFTNSCLDCHTYKAWKPAEKFNHETARYKLTGKHKEIACLKCHPNHLRQISIPTGLLKKKAEQDSVLQFKALNFTTCLNCHTDIHQGKLGANCSNCHTTEGFRSQQTDKGFDHSHTDYPLQGKHLQVACNRCHTSGVMTNPLKYGKCKDCHTDAHLNQFADRNNGGACESCHNVVGFIPAVYGIEEHQQCTYPLTGSHLAVACNLCHTPIQRMDGSTIANFDLKFKDCADCHKDVHKEQVKLWVDKGGCAYCHNTETWHRTSFDHSLASFALDGKHREILCLKCHYIQKNGVGKEVWMKPLSKDCAGCHKDPHQGQFLKAGDKAVVCEKCHQTDGWNNLLFAHNRDSQFILDGAHAKVACKLCHSAKTINDQTTVIYKPLGNRCIDCHQKVNEPSKN
jgi:hypothetical protein